MRSLRTTTKSSPRSPQLEKARTQQRRPNVAKKEKKSQFILFMISLLLERPKSQQPLKSGLVMFSYPPVLFSVKYCANYIFIACTWIKSKTLL